MNIACRGNFFAGHFGHACHRNGKPTLVSQGLLISEAIRSHSVRHTTVGRTPLDERSARHRDLYLTIHSRQTSMPPGGIRTRNPSKRAAADPRLRPRGHWVILYKFVISVRGPHCVYWPRVSRNLATPLTSNSVH